MSGVQRDVPTDITLANKAVSQNVIAYDGRLDNYHELRDSLGADADIPQEKLLLEAYRYWGKCVVERLLGEFSFAIWDSEHEELFCVRDHMGTHGLYYWNDGTQFLCSPDLQALLQHGAVSISLNRNKLALESILLADVVLGKSHETLFQGIFSLAGGMSLSFSSAGLQLNQYWQPNPEARLDIPDRDIPDALRELLFAAVEARLPDNATPAALLSGGLDSSALVAVAATVLKKRNRRLVALSAVLPSDASHGAIDESAYINQFSCFDNVQRISVTAPDRGPFDQVEQLVMNAGQPNLTSRHYLYTAFAEAAHEHGAVNFLDGCFGELGPTCHGEGFYQGLFWSVRWHLLLRELYLRSRVEKASLMRTTASHLVRPLLNEGLGKFGLAMKRHDLKQMTSNTPFNRSFLNQHIGAQFAGLVDQTNNILSATRGVRERQASHIAVIQKKAVPFNSVFMNSHLACSSFPFLDKRILEFCLAAPDHLKVRDGYKRSLIRHALDGILPPAIQWRTSKEPFSPDFHIRYNRQRPLIEKQLSAISKGDPVRAIVGVDKLLAMSRHNMSTNRCSTPKDFQAMHMVPRGVYLIAFLRQFPEFVR